MKCIVRCSLLIDISILHIQNWTNLHCPASMPMPSPLIINSWCHLPNIMSWQHPPATCLVQTPCCNPLPTKNHSILVYPLPFTLLHFFFFPIALINNTPVIYDLLIYNVYHLLSVSAHENVRFSKTQKDLK